MDWLGCLDSHGEYKAVDGMPSGAALSLSDVNRPGIDVCSALKACLERKLIRGHVSFEHIVTDTCGNCKLADWDEACFIKAWWSKNAPFGLITLLRINPKVRRIEMVSIKDRMLSKRDSAR